MRRKPLQCPLCDAPLNRPVDIELGSLELTGGICKCGAVYVLDCTGHNLGQVFMDALYFACKEDYDKALSLLPEEYETITLDYDHHSNTASITEDRPTRKFPKLFFLRLNETRTEK